MTDTPNEPKEGYLITPGPQSENPRRSEAIKLSDTYGARPNDRPDIPTTEEYLLMMKAVKALHLQEKAKKP